MAKDESGPTRAAALYSKLKADILHGVFAPGERLKIASLAQENGLSVSVAREALTRLVAHGLAAIEPNYGFTVVSMTRKELIDLRVLMVANGSVALSESIAKGGCAWEGGVVTAHHFYRLSCRRLTTPGDEQFDRTYETYVTLLASLFAGCENTRLLTILAGIQDAIQLYERRGVAIMGKNTQQIIDQLYAIVAAAIGRNSELACRFFAEHVINATDLFIETMWPEQSSDPEQNAQTVVPAETPRPG